MKIGIMTFPNSWSHGASLQMYALFSKLKSMGHDVEVINYFNEYALRPEKQKKDIRSMAKAVLQNVLHADKKRKFRRFEQRTVVLYPEKPIFDAVKLASLGERYDYVICGSDQVWNPDITNQDLAYFLNFCASGTKRISYAASFGVDSLALDFSKKIKPELEKFYAISVREQVGEKMIFDMLGKQADVVLDPTFFLCGSQWKKIQRSVSKIQGNYILYYTVSPSDSLYRFCEKLSAQTGLKIVLVGGNCFSKNTDHLLYANDIAPDELLYLIDHATYVVTNSFHGLAFSIHYRKNFYVNLSSATNSRLEQLIQSLALESRVVNEDSQVFTDKIDFSIIEGTISDLTRASERFLIDALE